MKEEKFSEQLTKLFNEHKRIPLGQLDELFGERSFAITFILLMMPSALPLPTGGVTNVFEIITALLALELVFGRKSLWIPKRWQKKSIRSPKPGKGMGRIVNFIRFVEKFSRPRGLHITNHTLFPRLAGILIVIFSLSAFIAPPFSGLDTLPGMAVVLMSLGLIFDDLVIVFMGIFTGSLGIALIVSLAGASVALVQNIWGWLQR